MPALADDDVVVHGDAERGGDVDDGLGHAHVGLRGRGIARGVIVQQSSLRRLRIEWKGFFDLSKTHWGMGLGSVVHDPT